MVLFRFADAVDAPARDEVLAALRALPSAYPAMRRFGLGPNVSDRDRRFTHVMSVEFADVAGLEGYLHSEEHERFVRAQFRPAVAERAIASFVVDEGGA
jgi:hypothetical protein